MSARTIPILPRSLHGQSAVFGAHSEGKRSDTGTGGLKLSKNAKTVATHVPLKGKGQSKK